MKFRAVVTRTCHQTIEFEVDAENAAEATKKAKELAPNEDFSGKEKEADYEVDYVTDPRSKMP
jgi:hypothetical protein